MQEWNLTVEQQLSHNTSLRVAYVGSFGVHELLSIDPNSIPAQICATQPAAPRAAPRRCELKGIAPPCRKGAQYIPGPGQPGRIHLCPAGFFWLTEGNSSYNALEADVTHRISKGLEFRGNYTWSKNLDINSGLTGAQANNQPQMVLDRNDLARGLGPVRVECRQPGQHFRPVTNCPLATASAG